MLDLYSQIPQALHLHCSTFLLGIRIDSNLSWNLHIDYITSKLNCRINLLRRSKQFLYLHCRKLLYNSLVKPILEYCCTVWGNCSKEQLNRLLRLQKRCARIILDANFQDNSVMLFTQLNWLPIDDIICARKLSLLHKISNDHGREYLSSYVNYVKSGHNYNTKPQKEIILLRPNPRKIQA